MTETDNPRQKDVVNHYQSVVDDAEKGGRDVSRQAQDQGAPHIDVVDRQVTRDEPPADGVLETEDGASIRNDEKRHDLNSNGPRLG